MACSSCGLEGVTGTCSMCYGDPDHNTDGEYRRMLEDDRRQQEESEMQDALIEQQIQEERDREAENG